MGFGETLKKNWLWVAIALLIVIAGIVIWYAFMSTPSSVTGGIGNLISNPVGAVTGIAATGIGAAVGGIQDLSKVTKSTVIPAVSQGVNVIGSGINKSNAAIAAGINKSNAQIAAGITKSNAQIASSVNKSNAQIASSINKSNAAIASSAKNTGNKIANVFKKIKI